MARTKFGTDLDCVEVALFVFQTPRLQSSDCTGTSPLGR